MKRKAYEDLVRWKNSKNRKPLLLQGARQVGKTYLVNEFAGKEYKDYFYFNFEQTPESV
ncbi:MAG: AAA family ATPase, partial [Candidatus Delongbacteria bacterium]|nr:AAA family ATPase [Candidatus Delongbacteria bacterium]